VVIVIGYTKGGRLQPLERVDVSIVAAKPKPDTGPSPMPTDKLYVAVVRDPMSVTPEQATLLGDTNFWNSLKTGGRVEWDFYANTSEDARKRNYLKAAEPVQKAGQPYVATILILSQETGKVLKVEPLPKDKAGVAKLLEGL
jgi:hypothetical protein